MDDLQENHKELIKINKLILTPQQRFRSNKHNVFTEEVNKIALSANNDKRIQSANSIETYLYGTRENLVRIKKMIKCNNRIQRWLALIILQNKT